VLSLITLWQILPMAITAPESVITDNTLANPPDGDRSSEKCSQCEHPDQLLTPQILGFGSPQLHRQLFVLAQFHAFVHTVLNRRHVVHGHRTD
jgi:hypothetical protein